MLKSGGILVGFVRLILCMLLVDPASCAIYWSRYTLPYFQDKTVAAKYNIDEFPTLMFFKNQIPSVYDEDLEKPDEILTWLTDLMAGADIEQITNDILDKFIATKSYLAVVFFKEDEKKSTEALLVLEDIDDDLDELGIMFVKLDDEVIRTSDNHLNILIF